jgi:hypothetical protein
VRGTKRGVAPEVSGRGGGARERRAPGSAALRLGFASRRFAAPGVGLPVGCLPLALPRGAVHVCRLPLLVAPVRTRPCVRGRAFSGAHDWRRFVVRHLLPGTYQYYVLLAAAKSESENLVA